MDEVRIAVVGLGYVGLPLAVAFGRHPEHERVIGFDISRGRINELQSGHDATNEVTESDLQNAHVDFTSDPACLREASFIIVAVPTPVTDAKIPDFEALEVASRIVGQNLQHGATVVFESTVYPGTTEEICAPIISEHSKLIRGEGWFLGYSPERANPGDREHTLATIVKVVSGENQATLELVVSVYEQVCLAGVHRASSIRVAEAAKVIENTYRDLNIALTNELAQIFARMGIPIADVLAAAATKWNFVRYEPGLVGGHCIGVDPYYLTFAAQQLGHNPEVILAGRKTNDGMAEYVANRVIRLIMRHSWPGDRTVLVLGMTFKQDVPDIRNSKVADVIRRLSDFGLTVNVFDPMLGTRAPNWGQSTTYESMGEIPAHSAVVLLVPHRIFLENEEALFRLVRRNGIFFDLKGAVPGRTHSEHVGIFEVL